MRSPDGRLFEVEKEATEADIVKPAAPASSQSFKKPAVIIGIAAVVLIALALIFFLPQFQSGDAPLEMADTYEIVFDASLAMADPLDGENTSKLEAAISGMNKEIFGYKVTSADNVALRFFRGDCEGDNPPDDKLDGLKHYFGKKNDEKVKNELAGLTTTQLKYDATLTKAIILAIKELYNATSHFDDPKIKREVIIITGGTGSCIEPAEKLQARIADLEKNIDVVDGKGATIFKNGQATSQKALDEMAVGTLALQVTNTVNQAAEKNNQLTTVQTLDNIEVRSVAVGLNTEQKRYFRALIDTVLGQKPYFADNSAEISRALGPKDEAEKFQKAKEDFLEAERLYFESQKFIKSDKAKADNLITEATGLFISAKDENIVRSYAFLGRIFHINKDRQLSQTFYSDGVEAGDPVAMWLLSDLLKTENPQEADRLLKEARGKGDITNTETYAKRMLGEDSL